MNFKFTIPKVLTGEAIRKEYGARLPVSYHLSPPPLKIILKDSIKPEKYWHFNQGWNFCFGGERDFLGRAYIKYDYLLFFLITGNYAKRYSIVCSN